MIGEPLRTEDLEALRAFDTCTVSNAIETFNVRLRNAGFVDPSVRCIFEDLPVMLGYAVTARMRSGEPPVAGRRFHDRSDWWNNILEMPAPRIVVIEDMDEPPGVGAFIGDVHAAILMALGCVGYVTNGGVRELPAIRKLGLQLFAGNVSVSHAYAHMFDFGAPIKIGRLEVRPGDLLHGDRHGVLSIPIDRATKIPEVARRMRENEKKVIEVCRSSQFSLAKLRQVIAEVGELKNVGSNTRKDKVPERR